MPPARLLLLLLAAAPLAGFADPTFSVTFPAGWSTRVDKGLIVATSPNAGDTDGSANCNASSNPTPATVTETQANLNQLAAGTWGPAEWASLMGTNPAKVRVIETSSRLVGGLQFRTGTVLFSANPQTGQRADATALVGFYALPGRVVMTGCYARPTDFNRMKARFTAVVGSLRVHDAPARPPG